MRTFRHFINWLKDAKGAATSLFEATATIAVGAVLAAAAVNGGISAIDNAKVQAAISDVQAIGQGVVSFYTDNSFFPLFADGQKTGAGDTFYGFLVSESGTYPTDSTNGFNGSGFTWQIPQSPSSWATNSLGAFGHRPDYNTGSAGHATIEGHLNENVLGDPTAPGAVSIYPLRGAYSGAPNQGWNGPYVKAMPKEDPWGNKYMVNIQYLNAGFLKNYTPNPNAPALPTLTCVVISAGPNRNIETPVDQPVANFKASGDDIVFVIGNVSP